MKKNIFLIGFIFLILLATAALAVSPHIQNSDDTIGLVLQVPKFSTLLQNQTYKSHTHLFNATTGLLVTNSSATCYGHIYNQSGHHIIEQQMGYDSNGMEFELVLGGENFTTQGEYGYVFFCNSSTNEGGFATGNFWVTKTGEMKDESGFPEFWAILLPLVIVLLLWLFAFKLDSSLQPFKMFFTGVGFALLFLPLQSLLTLLQNSPQLLAIISTLTYIYGWIFWGVMVFIVLNFAVSILEWIRGMKGGRE